MEEWYNLDKCRKYAPDALLYFICGVRRIGKTDCFVKEIFEQWDKHRYTAMWCRNKKVEFDQDFRVNFLKDAVNYGWCPEDLYIHHSGVYTDKTKEEIIVEFQSISTFSNRRGGAHPDCTNIVLDEFMPEDRVYPPNAHTGLMSLTKTVFSGNPDARCYCLSNYVSAANPYFVGFQIYPDKKLDVTYWPEKKIAIEVCRGYKCAIEDSNPWNCVYKAGGYKDYQDAMEDELFKLVSPIPRGGSMDNRYILHQGVTYGCTIKDGFCYWHKAPVNKGYIYATSLQECNDKISLVPLWLKKAIRYQLDHNVIRFQNPNVMYVILSLLFRQV